MIKSKLKYVTFVFLILLIVGCRKETPVDVDNLVTDNSNEFITLSSPQFGQKYSPGNKLAIRWETTPEVKKVNIDLYKKNELRGAIAHQISNQGSLDWDIPIDLTQSVHYKIKISSSSNSDVFIFSGVFSIIGSGK
ncbi:MAG: hypothetical protein NTX22_03165 [Ignavibacteriales bacterium]|nr:hypothetical protein [Ignavibacteriales bacterium]